MAQIKATLKRSPLNFLEDLLGAAALVSMLVVGLHLPGAF